MVKGFHKYVPKEVLEELPIIRLRYGILKDSECFKKMVEDSRIGREIRFTLDFNIKKGRKQK